MICKGALGRRTHLVALDKGIRTTSAKNIDVDYREGRGRVGHTCPNQERVANTANTLPRL